MSDLAVDIHVLQEGLYLCIWVRKGQKEQKEVRGSRQINGKLSQPPLSWKLIEPKIKERCKPWEHRASNAEQ